jgi:RNA polymerase sigma-70 factor (ECF subfamily)
MSFRRFADTSTRVLVNGLPGGVAWSPDGSPFAVVALTVRGRKIVAIDILADPDRLARLDLTEVAG